MTTARIVVDQQLLLTVILAVLLWSFRLRLRQHDFFRWWTWAWTAFAAYLAGGALVLRLAPGLNLPKQGLILASLVCGFLQVPLLILGASALRRPERPRTWARLGLLLTALFAALLFALATRYFEDPLLSFAVRTLPRTLALAAALAFCAWAFIALWRSNRSPAALLSGSACSAYAASQILYALIYLDRVSPPIASLFPRLPPTLLTSPLMFLDFAFESGVCVGTVLLLAEEYERAELAVLQSNARADLMAEHNAALQAEIAEREQAEFALRESEQRFSAAFLSSPVAISITREEDGLYVAVNDNYADLVGYSRAELLGHTSLELGILSPESRSKYLGQVQKQAVRDLELEFRNPKGETKWVIGGAERIPLGGKMHVIVNVVDITKRKRAEDALRETEERLRLFVEHAPAAIAMFDADMNYIAASNRWFSDYGLTDRNLQGRSHYDIFPDLPTRWREVHQRCLQGAVESSEAEPWVRADGRCDWVRWESRPWRKSDGSIGGLLIFSEVVTEQKRAEEALRASEVRIRSVFEQASDGIFVISRDNRYLDANKSGLALLGYTHDELLHMGVADVLAPHEVSRLAVEPERMMSGIPHLAEWVHRRKDGSLFVGEVSAKRLDENTYLAIVRDLTDRRRAEAALRESEERLRLALDAAHLGTFDWDIPGNHITWSRWHEEMWGYQPGEFPGTYDAFASRIHPDDLPGLTAEVARCQAAREPYLREFRVLWPDGSVHWIAGRGEFTHDAAGRAVRMRGATTDITARKQLEQQFQQAQKMEAVGRLAGGVAHDFNNLLGVIIGYSDLLLEEVDAEHARKRIAEVKRAAGRAADLTRQLLAFSRKQVMEPRILNLNDAVTDVEKLLRRLIGEDIELVLELAPSLHNVKADPIQIEQVIMNLAVNARDAMPGGGRLCIETRNLTLDTQYRLSKQIDVPPGTYVMLAVADTGVGMNEATKARIFEPFFTTKELGKGTGLGLATVYGIVKQSGGYVWVYSEVAEGTTFKIYLPAVAVSAPVQPTPLAGPHTLGSETILLVEDSPALRALNQEMLASLGYGVLAAESGADALRLAATYDSIIHLLLTDMVMPGMTGRELSDRLLALRPGLKVIYMSGYTDDFVTSQESLPPNSVFLQKPLSKEALARRLRDVLDARGERGQEVIV